jgi:hypothetical protein
MRGIERRLLQFFPHGVIFHQMERITALLPFPIGRVGAESKRVIQVRTDDRRRARDQFRGWFEENSIPAVRRP